MKLNNKKLLLAVLGLTLISTNSVVALSGCAARSAEYDWIEKDYDGGTGNEILVLGKGSAAEKFKGRPNEELMAEEAAIADAKGRLIDIVMGSYLESATDIKDREAVEQFGKTNLQGQLKGVVIKKRFFDANKRIYFVLVKLQRDDVKKLYNKLNEKFNLDIKYEGK